MEQVLTTKTQVVVPKQRAIYDALQRYAADNNGKYPQSLKQLVPKYVPEDPTQSHSDWTTARRYGWSTSRPSQTQRLKR
jgi:hypothetical protein